jgi:hypothetical protein
MDKQGVAQRIRERLDAGTLPRTIPPITTEVRRPSMATGHITADTTIGVVRCAACDELGAQVAFRFPDGRIVMFHGRCHRMWEEECQRAPRTS